MDALANKYYFKNSNQNFSENMLELESTYIQINLLVVKNI